LGSDVEIGLLHGRMSAEEKSTALNDFSSGKTPVLIATTVIEARQTGRQTGRCAQGCGVHCMETAWHGTLAAAGCASVH
jgi:superfamily II DNA/RNA helicase